MKCLTMVMNGHIIGHVDQDDRGKVTLTAPPIEGIPRLSLAFNPSEHPVSPRATRAYIEGLLPENEAVRAATARLTGGRANNPFSLLEAIGRDCPGAVQFIPEEVTEDLNEGSLTPVDEVQIGQRLRRVVSVPDAPWAVDGEHWSLGGQHVLRFAAALGVDGPSLLDFAEAAAYMVPAAFSAAINEVEPNVAAETLEHLRLIEKELTRHCDGILRRLA